MAGICAPTSFWNQRLPAERPIDAKSSTYVASLVKQTEDQTPNFETREYSLTTWTAGPEVPRKKVWLDVKDGTLTAKREMLESIPIPPELRPPGPFPGDNALAIYQPGTDEYFELYGMRFKGVDTMRTEVEVPECTTLNEAGWHCLAAAGVKNFSKSPGYWREGDWPGVKVNWGISGSNIFVHPGIIKIGEAQRLYIPHALRFETVNAQKTKFRWPAQSTDGKSESVNDPEAGMIFALPTSFKLSTIKDPFVRCVARAAQEFGIVNTDHAGNVSFKCQEERSIRESQSFTTDAWKGPEDKFGGTGAILSAAGTTLAKEFPWSSLEVLAESYRPSEIPAGSILKGG